MTTVPVNCDGTSPGTPTSTLTGGTITVPVPASPKFYRIDGPRPTKITSAKKVGTNLVIYRPIIRPCATGCPHAG